MDIEDDESTPVASTPSNGNMPINPIIEQPMLINSQINSVCISCRCYIAI